MLRKPITTYHMNIYELHLSDIIKIESKLKLSYKIINNDNILEVAELRNNSRLREFKKVIMENKAIGIAAYCDTNIVGYGWIKWKGSYDKFFRIEENKGYLASFFVSSKYRGNNVYPCLISKLIIKANELYGMEYFLIGIQKENNASIKGAIKTGFSFLKEYNLLRAFKMTIPKYRV